ncbi:MAG TPA: type II toxin-antitoxin system prevent-host-death family antitoxin [Planktothrix sp.]|jgi:prevent-host-death family protein
MANEMRIWASQFKTLCLKLMEDVQRSRIAIVITKRGKPIAKLVPFEDGAPKIYGFLAGSVKIHGDLITPIDGQWEA